MIHFDFQNHMTSDYKVIERKLKNLFNEHIAPVAYDEIVKLQIYHHFRRLNSLIIINKLMKNSNKDMRNHVACQYKCDMAEFIFSTYIGYSAC